MAERLKLRDQPDAEFPARRGELARPFPRDGIASPAQLRMRFEREVVVNLENQHVDSHIRQVSKVLRQPVEIAIAVVVEQVHGAPWPRAL